MVSHIIKKMKSLKKFFKVPRNQIGYMRFTLESYDGLALVRTLDSRKSIIEVYVPVGCENILMELIESMKIKEGIEIEEVRD